MQPNPIDLQVLLVLGGLEGRFSLVPRCFPPEFSQGLKNDVVGKKISKKN